MMNDLSVKAAIVFLMIAVIALVTALVMLANKPPVQTNDVSCKNVDVKAYGMGPYNVYCKNGAVIVVVPVETKGEK